MAMGYYDTAAELRHASKVREKNARNQEKRARKKAKRVPLADEPTTNTAYAVAYWRKRALAAEAKLVKPVPGFYDSPQWHTLRYKALKLHGLKCQLCGAEDTTLHVDHIKPRSRFPELALRLDNLQVLCAPCNMGKGAWDQSDWRKGSLERIP